MVVHCCFRTLHDHRDLPCGLSLRGPGQHLPLPRRELNGPVMRAVGAWPGIHLHPSPACYEPPKGKSRCVENISEIGSKLKYIPRNIFGDAKDTADYLPIFVGFIIHPEFPPTSSTSP